MKEEWFKEWFDSPYYHVLYKHRDDTEAASFIESLIRFLNPSPNATMLDLASGRGRHSIKLNSLGFHVTGLDLSPQNIQFASQYKNDSLNFAVHDMRNVYKENEFDYIFNLFTSFGYFQSATEDKKVLTSVYTMLKDEGKFIFDYLNVASLQIESTSIVKEIDTIRFTINKKKEKDTILKTIHVKDGVYESIFYEKVCIIGYDVFKSYFESCGFQIKQIFGDYNLNPFKLESSPRLILIAQK